MQKITTFLWFNDNAEEAAEFYVSLFKNSKVLSVQRLPEGTPGPQKKVLAITFQLEGQTFMALNGGPHYALTPAISLFVDCEDQAEVDALWSKLGRGGAPQACGWITDRFGLSWQIIPRALMQMMGDQDPAKAQRVMQAMLKMVKIDVAALQRAYEGRDA